MKIGHAMKDDDQALRDLEELTKGFNVADSKNEISNELDGISDSLRYNSDKIKDRLILANSAQNSQNDIQGLIDKIGAYLGETSMPKEEDAYLEHIQKMIDSKIAQDRTGTPMATSEIFGTANEKVDDNEIDKVFKEILAQESYYSDPIDLRSSEDDYLRAIASKLKESLAPGPVTTQEDVYASINELYPYLSMSFIRSVYDFKEDIATSYPLATDIILLHRISFVDLDDLRQFVEMVLDYNYRVNVDERKMIVDVMKEFKNEDGKILTNIFDIANHAKLFNGNYEGYHVNVL